MSTRSYIGVILFNYYNEKKVFELLKEGNMRSLHKDTEDNKFYIDREIKKESLN